MTRRHSKFRPCIDLHEGSVKQIVGGTIDGPEFKENFVADRDALWFAELFKRDGLDGGHVIRLGDGNDDAAMRALSAWPDGLQLGGGLNLENGQQWIDSGASHIIVTSWLFSEGELDWERVRLLAKEIGSSRLVIDLSCRKLGDAWNVATDRWKTTTDTVVNKELFERLAPYCDEFLVHSADVEGKVGGIDEGLVRVLSEFELRPVTYAGGIASFENILTIDRLSDGKLDFTVGSGLDIFGGDALKYEDMLNWNRNGSLSVQGERNEGF